MKNALVAMDEKAIGRVPLAKFYGTAINSDWRFGESESYLREMGALDESSTWLGPQVLIPNYVNSMSNCLTSQPYYQICCLNECDLVFQQLESRIGAPQATPSAIIKALESDASTNISALHRERLA